MNTAWIYLLCVLLLISRTQQQSSEDNDNDGDEDGDGDEEDDGDDGFIDGSKNYTTEEAEPDESIEELIVNSAESAKEFEFFYDENNAMLKVEYDMLYTVKEWGEKKAADEGTRRKRTAGIKNGAQGGYRWKNGRVNYQIARGIFNSYAQGQIKAAMNDWAKYTCLTFSRASSGNRIHFQNGGGCYSRVGMVGGAQTIGLAGGCRQKGTIAHEIGHAIGLNHEQTRPDRDQYVRIVNRNIPQSVRYNFDKNSWRNILNMGIPYDYYSIMHYGGKAFSYNGGITIQTVDPKYQNIIGRRHRLSFGDIKSINIMYNCKRAKDGCTKNDDDCPGQGFVGKDCQCWCPGDPYKLCGTTTDGGKTKTKVTTTTKTKTKTKVTTTTKTKTGCYNQHRSCSYWAQHGYCSSYPDYMLSYCKKSCNACNGKTTTTTSRRSCTDLHYNCPNWARYGYCNSYSYRSYMSSNCRKSCQKCSSSSPGTGNANSADCSDGNQYCSVWSQGGQCQANPRYMNQYCKKSCGKCTGSSSGASNAEGQTTCVDKDNYCPSWAQSGECQSNPGYMLPNCQISCGQCSTSQANAPRAAATPRPSCQDKHPWCTTWKNQGQCNGNSRQWMRLNCRRSCSTC